jgi:hypothetical protein
MFPGRARLSISTVTISTRRAAMQMRIDEAVLDPNLLGAGLGVVQPAQSVSRGLTADKSS